LRVKAINILFTGYLLLESALSLMYFLNFCFKCSSPNTKQVFQHKMQL